MRQLLVVAALTALAACGVDGPPQPPAGSPGPAVEVRGETTLDGPGGI